MVNHIDVPPVGMELLRLDDIFLRVDTRGHKLIVHLLAKSLPSVKIRDHYRSLTFREPFLEFLGSQ